MTRNLSAKKTNMPWLETIVTGALLYGIATHGDAQAHPQGDSQVVAQSQAAHVLRADPNSQL